MTTQIPAVMWNGRLVYAVDEKWYMSRKNEWKDWNYAASDSHSAAAGRLDCVRIERLTVLNSEKLLIETDNGNFVMRGEPSDGGDVVRDSGL